MTMATITIDMMSFTTVKSCDLHLQYVITTKRKLELRSFYLKKQCLKMEGKAHLIGEKLRFIEEKIEKFLPLIESIDASQQKINLLLTMEKLENEKKHLMKQNKKSGTIAFFLAQCELKSTENCIEFSNNHIAKCEARKLELINQGNLK
jgi:hypothetical protein